MEYLWILSSLSAKTKIEKIIIIITSGEKQNRQTKKFNNPPDTKQAPLLQHKQCDEWEKPKEHVSMECVDYRTAFYYSIIASNKKKWVNN